MHFRIKAGVKRPKVQTAFVRGEVVPKGTASRARHCEKYCHTGGVHTLTTKFRAQARAHDFPHLCLDATIAMRWETKRRLMYGKQFFFFHMRNISRLHRFYIGLDKCKNGASLCIYGIYKK